MKLTDLREMLHKQDAAALQAQTATDCWSNAEVSFASPPKIPFGRNITTAISSAPIQKS